MNNHAVGIIEKYYRAFNQQQMDTFLSLLDDNVEHDINQGHTEQGKSKFADFMERMNQCYRETIEDLIIMTNADGSHVAAEFIVKGTYLKSDKGLPEAKNQHYRLRCGAFFTLKHHKITRVSNFYNLNDWLEQIN